MEISISDRQTAVRINHRTLSRRTRKILNALGLTEGEVCLSLVDEAEMAELNGRWRGREGPTNVLTFAMTEGEDSAVWPPVLGDVVICAPVARAEADGAGLDLQWRVTELLVHGLLHLTGFDHETGPGAAADMEARSRRLLDLLADEEGGER
jgi:probable rRNA maturation factor